VLTLSAPGRPDLHISLAEEDDDPSAAEAGSVPARSASLCAMRVCNQSSLGYVYDAPQHAYITAWLSAVVGRYTCLARKSRQLHWPPAAASAAVRDLGETSAVVAAQEPKPVRPALTGAPAAPSATPAPASGRASFANEDDFLLVNASSVREVERRLREYVSGHKLLRAAPSASDARIGPERFRPNFVVDSAAQPLAAFAEDHWAAVRIGPFHLRVKGGCARCTMVNVDARSAERNSALYALLNTCRKTDQGKVLFGSLLSDLALVDGGETTPQQRQQQQQDAPQWWPIHVGMPCSAEST